MHILSSFTTKYLFQCWKVHILFNLQSFQIHLMWMWNQSELFLNTETQIPESFIILLDTYSVVLLGPLMVNSLSKAWAAYVCSTVLSACRWLISRGTACSSCSLGSWRKKDRRRSSLWCIHFASRNSTSCGESYSSYLASEDHDILDGICLQHWELINYNDSECLMLINVYKQINVDIQVPVFISTDQPNLKWDRCCNT